MAPRGLRMAFAVAAVAASAPAADAQFLRSMFGKGVGSSSYFSSSTWSVGQDGEMHQQVQKMSSEMMDTPMGPQRVEKKMVCKDGYCREEVVVLPPQGPEAQEAMVAANLGMGFRAREMLERLMGRQRGPAPPVIEVVAVPAGRPEPRPNVVEMVQPMPDKHFALRGMMQRMMGGPSKYVNVEIVPAPHPVAATYVPNVHSFTRPFAISCLIASSVLLATLVAALRLQSSASARELPSLAEPLASAEGAAPTGLAAPAAKKEKEQEQDSALTSARFYLKDLYAQVLAKAEHQAISQYLDTVYARATA